jgi:hypothetical protein
MKTLKRGGKVLVAALLIVAGGVVGLNPRWELRKLFKRDGAKDAPPVPDETKPLY